MNSSTSQKTINQICCQNSCDEHYPRCPYTHSEKACDNCCIGCDKPGIGAVDHNPSDNACSDCALFCLPIDILADILCCPCMVFGFWNVDKP
jgi:hypothetical protein